MTWTEPQPGLLEATQHNRLVQSGWWWRPHWTNMEQRPQHSRTHVDHVDRVDKDIPSHKTGGIRVVYNALRSLWWGMNGVGVGGGWSVLTPVAQQL